MDREYKEFATEIRAIDVNDGELKVWRGPTIFATDEARANEFCRQYLGYCVIVGEVSQIQSILEFNNNGVYLFQPDIWIN